MCDTQPELITFLGNTFEYQGSPFGGHEYRNLDKSSCIQEIDFYKLDQNQLVILVGSYPVGFDSGIESVDKFSIYRFLLTDLFDYYEDYEKHKSSPIDMSLTEYFKHCRWNNNRILEALLRFNKEFM